MFWCFVGRIARVDNIPLGFVGRHPNNSLNCYRATGLYLLFMFASILGPVLLRFGVHFVPYFRGEYNCVFSGGLCLACVTSLGL